MTQFSRPVLVNGVNLLFRISDLVSLDDIQIPGTDLYLVGHTPMSDLYKAAGLETFDFAMPQPWFDAYIEKHGESPRGVWYYPPSPDPCWLCGRFVSFEEALERVGQRLAELEPEHKIA